MTKVTIAIVSYNSVNLLQECLQSCLSQSYQNYEIIFVDQGSSDSSVHYVETHFQMVRVIKNANTGYSGGANKAYYETDGEYLLIMNPDVILKDDYVEKLVKVLNIEEKIGVITGKILKLGEEKMLDTTGLLALRNRRIVDRGQGLHDDGQFEKTENVFGVSGCIALYRRSALHDIELKDFGEVWDNDFFMYKEDIDVSWRLNLRGWICRYEPSAIAFHKRGTEALKRYTNREVLRHRKSVPALAKYCSYRNQRLMQVKNEIVADLVSDFFVLAFREIATLIYVIVFEPIVTGKSVISLFCNLPRAWKKRQIIQNQRKVSTMKKFFTKKSS